MMVAQLVLPVWGPMEHKGKPFDRLYVTSRTENTLCLSMFSITHLYQTHWHLVPPKTIRGEAGQQYPLNICLCRLKAVQHGWPCVPAGFHMPCLDNVAQSPPVGVLREGPSLLLSPALRNSPPCLPADPPASLTACLPFLATAARLQQTRGPPVGAVGRLGEFLSSWMRRCASVLLLRRDKQKGNKKKMLQQSKTPKWCLPNVVAQLGRLEGTDTDNTLFIYNRIQKNMTVYCKINKWIPNCTSPLCHAEENLSRRSKPCHWKGVWF